MSLSETSIFWRTREQTAELRAILDRVRTIQCGAYAAMQQLVEVARGRDDLFLDRDSGEFGDRENLVAEMLANARTAINMAFDSEVSRISEWEPDHKS